MRTNLEVFELGCKAGYEAGLQGRPCPVGFPAALSSEGGFSQSKYEAGKKAGFDKGTRAHEGAKRQILDQVGRD